MHPSAEITAPEILTVLRRIDTRGARHTAYNRTKFLKERKAMMQLWADYLEKLKAGAEVIQLRGEVA